MLDSCKQGKLCHHASESDCDGGRQHGPGILGEIIGIDQGLPEGVQSWSD